MAIGAFEVVDLRPAGVIDTGYEVDIVVTGPAGGLRGSRQPGIGLSRSVVWIVAGLTPKNVGGIHGRGPVVNRVHETDNLIWLAGLHAGQRTAIVNLMDEHLHVERIAGVGIGV